MFEKLTDFSFQRSRKQALGFYIVWVLGGSIITAIVVDIYIRFFSGAPMPKATDIAGSVRALQAIGKGVVPTVILVFSVAMAALVIKAKKAYNIAGLICIVFAAIFSFIGLILSLVPVAYLTTLPKSSS